MKGSLKIYIIIITATSLAVYQLSNMWMLMCSVPKNLHTIYINNILQDGEKNVVGATSREPFPHGSGAPQGDSILQDEKENVHESNSESSRILYPTMRYLPPLYIITPTYRRPEQLADLTRLSHTLMLVPNVVWLVIEDADVKSPLVGEILQKTGIPFDHMTAPMPDYFKNQKKKAKPKGVSNRNRGLKWIRENATEGVFYFADDDNSYDLDLFNEMRFTKMVSMWPVGLVTRLGVSSPVVKNGKFAGFYDGWIAGRQYPVDMAGFAVSVKFLLERPKALMPFAAEYEEDGFLKSLRPFKLEQIELLASNCTKILVWHTQTKRNLPAQRPNAEKYGKTNIAELIKLLV